jgi:hypothetical protein
MHDCLLLAVPTTNTLLQGGNVYDIPPAMYKASAAAINGSIFILYGGRVDTSEGTHRQFHSCMPTYDLLACTTQKTCTKVLFFLNIDSVLQQCTSRVTIYIAGTILLRDLYILDLRNDVNTWRKVDLQPSKAQKSFTLLAPFDSKLQIVGQDLVITASGGLRACAPAS